MAGALLFALAAFVAFTSVTSLLGYSEPKPTILGLAILVAAAVVMPWLAKQKRQLSGATGSAALRADAAQSAMCAYLSLIALAGLAVNALWKVKLGRPDCGFSRFCRSSFGRVGKPCAGRSAAAAKRKSRLFMSGSKGLPPVLLQAVVQKGAAVAALGGQPGKGFEPLVVVALFLRVVRHSAFVLAGRPTNILADYNFA